MSDSQRDWIDWRFQCLRSEFGEQPLQQPVVTPSNEFFPDPYFATWEDVQKLFRRVSTLMNIDPSRIKFQYYNRRGDGRIVPSGFNAAGLYDKQASGEIVIWLEESHFFDAPKVVAICAHELAHVHLLADGHCDSNEPDHEHLADLLVIYFGLGIFTANAIRRDKAWTEGALAFTSLEFSGYLKMPEAAYALALYAHFRKEKIPSWIKFLRADVRADFKVELNRLSNGHRRIWSDSGGPKPKGPSNVGLHANALPEKIGETSDVSDRPIPLNPLEASTESRPELSQNETSYDSNCSEAGGPDSAAISSTECLSSINRSSDGHEPFTEVGPSADDYFATGVVRSNEGAFLEAIEAFTTALRLNPHDSEALRERAKANLGVGNFEATIGDATERLDVNPGDAYARRYRAQAYLELERYTDAINDVNLIHKRDQLESDLLLRALGYLGAGDLNRAVKELTLAIAKDPLRADPYLARSRAYDALGKSKLAKSDLDEAIRRNPDYTSQELRESVLAFRIPILR